MDVGVASPAPKRVVNLSVAQKRQFNEHVRAAKAHEAAEELHAAVHEYSCALAIDTGNTQLPRKIQALERKIDAAGGTRSSGTDETAARDADSGGDENVATRRLTGLECGAGAGADVPTKAPAPAAAEEMINAWEWPRVPVSDTAVLKPRQARPQAAAAEARTLFGDIANAAPARPGTNENKGLRRAASLIISSPESPLLSSPPRQSATAFRPPLPAPTPRQAAIVIDDESSNDEGSASLSVLRGGHCMNTVPSTDIPHARPMLPAAGSTGTASSVSTTALSTLPDATPESATIASPAIHASAASPSMNASTELYQIDAAHEIATLPGGFTLPLKFYSSLFDYQRLGVAWMWSLHPACPAPTGSLGRGHVSEGAAWEGGMLSGGVAPIPHALKQRSGQKLPGGILADDMGLGKTVMTVAFVSGLFHAELANAALIVAPVSVLPVWEAEFKKWAPEVRVRTFHGAAPHRDAGISTIMRRGGVVLTTYGMVTNNPDLLGGDPVQVKAYWAESTAPAADSSCPEDDGAHWPPVTPARARTGGASAKGSARRVRAPRTPHGVAPGAVSWDAIVLDEGHKIKNPSTQISKALRLLPAHYRLLLSGTPLQNNMDELWSLFDYVCAGQLLGTRREFNRDIANVILRSRDRNASTVERSAGQVAYQKLSSLVQPHMLRREKARLQESARATRAAVTTSGLSTATTHAQHMPRGDAPLSAFDRLGAKTELVLWTTLATAQVDLYKAFLSSSTVQAVLNASGSMLAAISVMRNITSHPLLLGAAFREAMSSSSAGAPRVDDGFLEAAGADDDSRLTTAQQWDPASLPDVATLVALSGKVQLLLRLVQHLLVNGDKVLIFSQSRRMLDILEKCLGTICASSGICRIDGALDVDARRSVVESFNTVPSHRICLLTTGVGAHGLTLTSANRVIIFDPSWNPAVDSQAVDRAYRVGQTRDVITYRLISCGTVEEAMYRLQVFKTGMTSSVMAATSSRGCGAETRRLLTRDDLRQIFQLGDIKRSATKGIIDEVADPPELTSLEVANHLRTLGDYVGHSCAGISHHDSLFNLSERDRGRFADATRAIATEHSPSLQRPDGRRRTRERGGRTAPPRSPESSSPTCDSPVVIARPPIPVTGPRTLRHAVDIIESSSSDEDSEDEEIIDLTSSPPPVQNEERTPSVSPPHGGAAFQLAPSAYDSALLWTDDAGPIVLDRQDDPCNYSPLVAPVHATDSIPSPVHSAAGGSVRPHATPVLGRDGATASRDANHVGIDAAHARSLDDDRMLEQDSIHHSVDINDEAQSVMQPSATAAATASHAESSASSRHPSCPRQQQLVELAVQLEVIERAVAAGEAVPADAAKSCLRLVDTLEWWAESPRAISVV